MSDLIRITRDELFAKEVDRALEKERRLRNPLAAAPEPISPLRGLLMSSLFYLPAAGFLAGLAAWLLLEPHFEDFARVGGEVVLVNEEPFQFAAAEGLRAISLAIGENEVLIFPDETVFEPGADGQPAFQDVAEIEPGDVIEAVGEPSPDGGSLLALAVRPATLERALAQEPNMSGPGGAAAILLFPATATLIALALILADGISSRNWLRMIDRALIGTLLTAVFTFLAYVPAGLLGNISLLLLEAQESFTTVEDLSGGTFLVLSALRDGMWTCIGAALGVGMSLARSTRAQLRNAVVGGALGGALGGTFFDSIDRFTGDSVFEGGDVPRLVGLVAVGLCVGVFVALVDRLAREAWLRVRSGPLAGKSFVLYKTPTLIGSAPQADIYLFKDAEIEPSHAAIHRAGNVYEIEDLSRRAGVQVGGRPAQRRRLSSGDQVIIGATILEFEERTKRGRSNV